MANSLNLSSSSLSSIIHIQNPKLFTSSNRSQINIKKQKLSSVVVRAAKQPDGVIFPKAEPKFNAPFLGFTNTAETWNSRACMMGLIGTFIVELILHKGVLELIGVEIGKGLDLPL